MGVQRAMEVGTKIRDWQPVFEAKKVIEKGRQFCSSKSSYSYYVESVIEELKNENLTVFFVGARLAACRGHLTLGIDAFLVF